MPTTFISDFLSYLEHNKKYSKHTVLAYGKDIAQCQYYLFEMGVEDMMQATHLHLRSWVVDLLEGGVSAKSINRKISSLNSFYKYLKRVEKVDHNPMRKVTAPKIPKRLPTYVDEVKMGDILDKNRKGDFSGFRDYIVISLLYHTGMRRAELLGIQLSDVDLVQKSIKVLGKGNKERIIPLNEAIATDLGEYIRLKNETFGQFTGQLIVTNKGKPAYPKLIYTIVHNVLKKYNASEKASPHILRHTFATHLTANGAELNAVKDLLGHANLSATQIYTHNSIERLKEVYDKSHPKSKSR